MTNNLMFLVTRIPRGLAKRGRGAAALSAKLEGSKGQNKINNLSKGEIGVATFRPLAFDVGVMVVINCQKS